MPSAAITASPKSIPVALTSGAGRISIKFAATVNSPLTVAAKEYDEKLKAITQPNNCIADLTGERETELLPGFMCIVFLYY
jgi:hypothetical protein